jgi:hypothetical protein
MNFPVIVRADSPDQFTAQSLGIPELKTVARTEAEAIERASQALVQWLASARVVQVSIPVPDTGHPWLDAFGRSAQDPDFDEYLEAIEQARAADEPE